MEKGTKLKALQDKISTDQSLPLQESNLVFGEGNENCQVMFIGEAPGFHENEQKRPFVGRAGQLLNQCLSEIGWQREGVYITNIVKRRPPGNRDPLPEEISAYEPYLKKQIEIIAPPVIITLGRFAMNYFIPAAKITRDQGKVFRLEGFHLIPMLHPAAALRSTDMLQSFRNTFKALPAILSFLEKKGSHDSKMEADKGV